MDFLRAAQDTKARFLLTSRRTEQDWLKDLPARIGVPPMPFQERVQLTRALAERHGRLLQGPVHEGDACYTPAASPESMAGTDRCLNCCQQAQ